MGKTKQRKPRRLAPVPEPTLPLGELAVALREACAAKGLTQEQTALAIGVSTSTVQRAESGKRVPERHFVDGYVDSLGLNAEQARELRVKAITGLQCGRRRRH